MSSICTTKLAVLRRRVRRLMNSTTRLYAPAMALAMTKYLPKQISHLSQLILHGMKQRRFIRGKKRRENNSNESTSLSGLQAYTNAGVSLNSAVKVCVSGLVPTMATTAV